MHEGEHNAMPPNFTNTPPPPVTRNDPAWFDLISVPIVGMQHRGPHARTAVGALVPEAQVQVLREKANAHDPNAIMVRVRGTIDDEGAPLAWQHVGYVPAVTAGWLATLLDNGHRLRGYVEFADAAQYKLVITLRMQKAPERA